MDIPAILVAIKGDLMAAAIVAAGIYMAIKNNDTSLIGYAFTTVMGFYFVKKGVQ